MLVGCLAALALYECFGWLLVLDGALSAFGLEVRLGSRRPERF
jgi:hypothetical protein